MRVFTVLVFGLLFVTPRGFAQETKHKAPLVLAWDVMPRTYDPRYAVDANSQYLENLLHCSLIEFTADGQVEKSVAQEWRWLKPTVLEVHIRDDVTFADGSKLSSAEVKATYDFFLEAKPKHPSPRSAAFKNVLAIEAAPRKVIFTLREPDPGFITNMVVGILPRALAKDMMITAEHKVLGCGPFVLESAHLTGLSLRANTQYVLGPQAKSAQVEIKAVKDENTCFLKLQKGEVDITQNAVSLDRLETLSKDYPQLKVLHRPGLNTSYLGFNAEDPVLRNKLVRQAIDVAIDRQAIIKYLLKGMAIPARTLLLPGDKFYNPSLPVLEFNPAKAKVLLDQAGYKPGAEGIRFALTFKTSNNATRTAIAKAIASNLLAVGIKVSVLSLDWGKFKLDVDKGHVQMWGLSWVGFKDPTIYNYAFATSNFPPHGANRGRFSQPALDALFSQAQLSTAEEPRRKIYEEVQKIVAEEAPYVFLYHEDKVAILNKAVEGFQVYADGRYSAMATAHK